MAMHAIPYSKLLFLIVVVLACSAFVATCSEEEGITGPSEFQGYVCYRCSGRMVIDGKLDEASWQMASYSDDFIDIEGNHKPVPRYVTRMKMLWDDQYLFIGAWLEEPHIWATLTERDATIFWDNDFEVFIDPDGDTHNYYEFEINALNTVWDLLLEKPYRDGGPYRTDWNIDGLKTGVFHQGTINDPSDVDEYWTVEIAMPWKSLIERAPDLRLPNAGDQWRINFSRVQWQLDVVNGKYVKRISPESGKHLKEDNWVWSPQNVINMHQPETWGFVQFSGLPTGSGSENFILKSEEYVKWFLRNLYYQQREYKRQNNRYALTLEDLDAGKFQWKQCLEDPRGSPATGNHMKSPGERQGLEDRRARQSMEGEIAIVQYFPTGMLNRHGQ